MSDPRASDRDVFERVAFVLCDLDGVVWLAREAIPGAPEAVQRLRESGRRVVFVTNNSVSVVAEQEQALAKIGITAEGDVVTSAQAAASLVAPDERVMVCGGRGIREAVEARGAIVIEPRVRSTTPDSVIVGLARDIDYAMLDATSAAVRAGARYIATNDDPTFPTASRLTPGAGAIVAAITAASGSTPTIAGKPHAVMGDLVRVRCGPEFAADSALMVGDRWSTDGSFADVLGCPFALVRSGVTRPGAEAGGVADIDEDDLAAVADALLGV